MEDFQLTYNLDEAREDLLKGYYGNIKDLKLVAATRKPLIIRHIPIINLNRISSDFNLQTFDTSSSNEPQRAEVYDFVLSFRSSNDNLQNISIKSGAILLYDAKNGDAVWAAQDINFSRDSKSIQEIENVDYLLECTVIRNKVDFFNATTMLGDNFTQQEDDAFNKVVTNLTALSLPARYKLNVQTKYTNEIRDFVIKLLRKEFESDEIKEFEKIQNKYYNIDIILTANDRHFNEKLDIKLVSSDSLALNLNILTAKKHSDNDIYLTEAFDVLYPFASNMLPNLKAARSELYEVLYPILNIKNISLACDLKHAYSQKAPLNMSCTFNVDGNILNAILQKYLNTKTTHLSLYTPSIQRTVTNLLDYIEYKLSPLYKKLTDQDLIKSSVNLRAALLEALNPICERNSHDCDLKISYNDLENDKSLNINGKELDVLLQSPEWQSLSSIILQFNSDKP